MKLSLDELNDEQRKAVEELRTRVKDAINQNMYEDILLFFKFLGARDFKINDAENMLRKHIIWRKVYQVATILEDFKPKEFFTKYVEPSMIGLDKEGNLLVYIPCWNMFPKEIYKCEKKNDIIRHLIWCAEKMKRILIEENKKSGRNATQFNFIVNADQVSFENATNKDSIDFWLQIMSINQDNFPEYMKAMYIINAPAYCTILLTVVKATMSNKMIQKLHAFGSSGWKEKLLEVIDADSLPAFLGGNRTDPDGDPLCKTFINHGGHIPTKYVLSDEEKYFTKGTEINKVILLPSERKDIFVDVKTKRALIQWEFYCKSDINFGLFHETSNKNIEEIIPIVTYSTSTGTEKNFHRTQSTGKYIIVFENTHSWLGKKEVEYSIVVIDPIL